MFVFRWEKVITIPGTTNAGRIEENIGSKDINLDEKELDQIQKILNSFKVHGEQLSFCHYCFHPVFPRRIPRFTCCMKITK